MFDLKYVKRKRLEIGYFRFKGYCLPYYYQKDRFVEGITFENIYYNYRFDERLRLLLFQVIEHVEVELKAIINTNFALKYGPLAYYDSIHFYDAVRHSQWIKDNKISIKKASRRNELFTKHYIDKYEGTFPIWVTFEMISFGDLSKFFNNMHSDFQEEICNENFDVHPVLIKNWLYILSVVRNMCAHTCRVYDKRLPFKMKIPKEEKLVFSDEKAFAIVYICDKLCLDRVYFERFISNLITLIQTYDKWIDMDSIGFPENWIEVLTSDSKMGLK
ncbi:Abi family protein [Listeria monocytogenes]|uniref:Abi family protein n=1 Tax=Listeria monocytogenes TaxID=1639 RepID=UPI001E2B489C|nr:Abi family protein [Listeria monocytogenes]MCD2228618.1 Abi family protein [Listeria monocytogenes]